MKDVNWAWVVPIASFITAMVATIAGFVRNRRSDTITLYSSFVDDLHVEVKRLRTQYEEDRKQWDSREHDLLDRIERLRGEISSLQDEVSRLRSRVIDREDDVPVPGKSVPKSTQAIIAEVVKQLRERGATDE